MQFTLNISIILGAIGSLLLSVIAFFLKQLLNDFRKLEKDIGEMKTTTQLIKSEFKSSYDLLNQRVGFIEKRMDIYEHVLLGYKEKKKAPT